jgi:hypothetical protein
MYSTLLRVRELFNYEFANLSPLQGKKTTGTRKTGIRRIPAGITYLGKQEGHDGVQVLKAVAVGTTTVEGGGKRDFVF